MGSSSSPQTGVPSPLGSNVNAAAVETAANMVSLNGSSSENSLVSSLFQNVGQQQDIMMNQILPLNALGLRGTPGVQNPLFLYPFNYNGQSSNQNVGGLRVVPVRANQGNGSTNPVTLQNVNLIQFGAGAGLTQQQQQQQQQQEQQRNVLQNAGYGSFMPFSLVLNANGMPTLATTGFGGSSQPSNLLGGFPVQQMAQTQFQQQNVQILNQETPTVTQRSNSQPQNPPPASTPTPATTHAPREKPKSSKVSVSHKNSSHEVTGKRQRGNKSNLLQEMKNMTEACLVGRLTDSSLNSKIAEEFLSLILTIQFGTQPRLKPLILPATASGQFLTFVTLTFVVHSFPAPDNMPECESKSGEEMMEVLFIFVLLFERRLLHGLLSRMDSSNSTAIRQVLNEVDQLKSMFYEIEKGTNIKSFVDMFKKAYSKVWFYFVELLGKSHEFVVEIDTISRESFKLLKKNFMVPVFSSTENAIAKPVRLEGSLFVSKDTPSGSNSSGTLFELKSHLLHPTRDLLERLGVSMGYEDTQARINALNAAAIAAPRLKRPRMSNLPSNSENKASSKRKITVKVPTPPIVVSPKPIRPAPPIQIASQPEKFPEVIEVVPAVMDLSEDIAKLESDIAEAFKKSCLVDSKVDALLPLMERISESIMQK